MLSRDDILNVNFDVKKLSNDELIQARALLRDQLVLVEKQRVKFEKKGIDSNDLYHKIRKLDQALAKIRVQLLIAQDS